MTRAALLAPVLAAAACLAPRSTECEDSRYCAAHMVCGTGDSCLAEPGECRRFTDGTPCIDAFGRGHCEAGTCTPGVRLFGAAGDPMAMTPHEGVSVTVIDHPEVLAATTDVDGRFALADVPKESVVVVALARDGLLPVQTRELGIGRGDYVLDDDPDGAVPMVPDTLPAQVAAALGIAIDPGRGLIVGLAFDPIAGAHIAGAVPAIAPASGDGPYYIDEMARPDPEATATLDAGGFVFLNVAPGVVELSITAPSEFVACNAAGSDGPAVMRLPVAPGVMTWAGHFNCWRP